MTSATSFPQPNPTRRFKWEFNAGEMAIFTGTDFAGLGSRRRPKVKGNLPSLTHSGRDPHQPVTLFHI
jgi:hypothetical protein